MVYDEETKRCLVIDPGSEKSLREIHFIEEKKLYLDYIILTHEHTDHNWGVNSLRGHFPDVKLVCSECCNNNVKKTNRAYFLFYYDDPEYRYEIAPADILIKEDGGLDWNACQIKFVMTPGHSYGSMCIDINNMLFTGDTIMPFKPYFNSRDSNEEKWKEAIRSLENRYSLDTMIFPGHGGIISFESWQNAFCKKPQDAKHSNTHINMNT